MPRTIVIGLSECVLNLYETDALGNPIASRPVWLGARTEQLEMVTRIEELDVTPSGAYHREHAQLGMEHEIRIGQVWSLNGQGYGDFPVSRGKFVLMVYGEERKTGVFHRRTYYGVQVKERAESALGQTAFQQTKAFRATHFRAESGRVLPGQASQPGIPSTPQATGPEEPLLFIHPGQMAAGSYFMGQHQFEVEKQVVFAKAVGQASQGTATTVQLEVNGGLVAVQLVLGTGAVNAQVEASGTFAVNVPANQVMRWKVVGAPSLVDNMGWMGSVNMNVKSVS